MTAPSIEAALAKAREAMAEIDDRRAARAAERDTSTSARTTSTSEASSETEKRRARQSRREWHLVRSHAYPRSGGRHGRTKTRS